MIAFRVAHWPTRTRLLQFRHFSLSHLLPVIQVLKSRARKHSAQTMAPPQDYSEWSHEQLQERIKLLDSQLEHLAKQLAKFEPPVY